MGSGSPTCPRTHPSFSRLSTSGPSSTLVGPEGIGLASFPPPSPGFQRADPLCPVLDEPLANHYFATLADLEHVVTERCRVLNHDQLKPGTNFHWWPKPDIPA